MSMIEDILSQMQGAPVQQVASQLGVDPAQAQQAIGAALPMIVGALGQNASQPGGADVLAGVLGANHGDAAGGGLGGLLGSVLGSVSGQQATTPATDGGGILGHIFGSQEQQASNQVGQATGLGSDQAQMLMKILAPIVMAYLAKRMFSHPDSNNANSVSDVLQQEQSHVDSGGGLLGQVLGSLGGGGGIGGLLGSVLGGRS
ncbi:MAG: DUF937 domain-containing protein [Proteobacteria bacterium]|nr:DUF937 domain-containing protein [Pseudomonadota bacterium]